MSKEGFKPGDAVTHAAWPQRKYTFIRYQKDDTYDAIVEDTDGVEYKVDSLTMRLIKDHDYQQEPTR